MILLTAGPALGDPPRPERHRDWQHDCPLRACPVHTSVAGADGTEVLRLSVGAESVLAVTTPLPLFLPDGMVLAVGARPTRPVPWRTCRSAGCEATLPLDAELLTALRRARAGSVTLTLVDGVQVRLPFSLLGFTAALAALGGAAD